MNVNAKIKSLFFFCKCSLNHFKRIVNRVNKGVSRKIIYNPSELLFIEVFYDAVMFKSMV